MLYEFCLELLSKLRLINTCNNTFLMTFKDLLN